MITISISPSLVRFGADKFRSDRRYLRSTSAAALFLVPSGPTLALTGVVAISQISRSPVWRYSVGSFEVVPPYTTTFAATVTSVTTE